MRSNALAGPRGARFGGIEAQRRRLGEAPREGVGAVGEPAGLGASQRGGIERVELGDAAHGATKGQSGRIHGDFPAALGRQRHGIEPLHQRLRGGGGAGDVGGQRAGDRGLFGQIDGDGRRQPVQALVRLAQPDRFGLQLGAFEHAAIGVGQACLGEHLVEQEALERAVILQIALVVAALGAIERRLRDEEMAAVDQFRHLAEEEGEQQRADVRAVHVGVGHDDDAVVAQLSPRRSRPARARRGRCRCPAR